MGTIDVPAQFTAMMKQRPIIASYAPIGSEADPSTLVKAAQALGCIIALPRVTSRAAELSFHCRHTDHVLVEGPFGLRQPSAETPLATPAVILTPLLGFTRSGIRLGQGAGHYDRAFARHPDAIRIGIAWSVQERDQLPEDTWDVRLHIIVTEREWIVTS